MKERDHLAAQRSLRWTRKMDKSLPSPSCDNPAEVYGENVGKMRRNTEAWNTYDVDPTTELKDGLMVRDFQPARVGPPPRVPCPPVCAALAPPTHPPNLSLPYLHR